MKVITLRMPKEVLAMLKQEYANTYPQHRLSFNAWAVQKLTINRPTTYSLW